MKNITQSNKGERAMQTLNTVREKAKTISLVAAGLIVGGAASLAFATIPDSAGTIHGCYTPGTNKGGLRVIDDSVTACKSSEAPLNWTQNPTVPTPSYAHVIAGVGANGALVYSVDTSRSTSDVIIAGQPSNSVVCLKTTFTVKSLSAVPEELSGQGGDAVVFKDGNGWSDATLDSEQPASSFCDQFNANVLVRTTGSNSFFINFIK